MAQTGNKKTTTKKPSAAKNKKKKKKKSSNKGNQILLSEIILKQEVKSTLIFIFGLFLAITAFLSGGTGSLWNKLHLYYFALTGISGFFIPPAVLFIGVLNVLNKQQRNFYIKTGEVFLFFVVISAFIHINSVADAQIGFFKSIGNIFQSVSIDDGASQLHFGGVFGALTGGLLFSITKSRVVSNIINILFLLADIMALFGVSLVKLFSEIERPAKKVGAYTGDKLEKTKNEIIKKKQQKNESDKPEKSSEPPQPVKKKQQQTKKINKKNSPNDPLWVVEDFYKNNHQSHMAGQTDTQGENASKIESPDIFYDTAGEYPPETADIKRHADRTSETARPLSEAEAEALNSNLDKAINDVGVTLNYHKPPLNCLNEPTHTKNNYTEHELNANGEKLIAALRSFNVSATIVNVVPGPTVTRYELSPAPGVKISKFVGLSDDLALHMAAPAGLRIEAPIPNKAAIGIEIPNRNKTTVTFREIIDTDKFKNAKSKLNVALGKDIAGDPVFSDLAKMPHLLVAGTTGSGKSVCLNTMIVSLLYNATPDEVKLLLIDPKQVEFGVYNGLPHLLVPVVSDPRKASGALGWAVTEMLSRYKTLNANGVRDIGAYNSLCEEREDLTKMPQIVIFIDELSDLMTVAPAEVEDSIQRLAQMARAAGMHLVVATQRPSVDVITGVIKANIPSRIALTVKSQIDSRTIIDSAGAEKLMGNGDMLYYPVGVPKPLRVQGSFLDDSEIERVVSFIKSNGGASYDDNVQKEIDRQAAENTKKKGVGETDTSGGIDSGDDLLTRAIELFVNTPEKASISALQRHLGMGFAKAGRLMDTLEEKGIVGPSEGSKPRKVLITKSEWYEMNAKADPFNDSTVATEGNATADDTVSDTTE